MLIQDQFGIIENLQMSPIPKTSQDQFLGLDFSNGKTTVNDVCFKQDFRFKPDDAIFFIFDDDRHIKS